MPPLKQYFDAQQAHGGCLIVVDPRRTATAAWAHQHLPIRPATDAALANGILHVLIRGHLIDSAFVRGRTDGFEEVRRIVSDRIGGYRLLLLLLGAVAVSLGVFATLPPLALAVPTLFVAVGCLGMGNGAVFQLVPQRFAGRMGIITGIVGAAGGLGGFFPPSILGAAKDATGTYGSD